MTFIFNPSPRLSVVRQIAAVKILFAVLAMIAGGLQARAQSASATPVPSPAPASTPEAKLSEVKTSSGTVIVPPGKSQPIRIARFEKPPVIDGKLGDDQRLDHSRIQAQRSTFFVKMSYLFRKSF